MNLLRQPCLCSDVSQSASTLASVRASMAGTSNSNFEIWGVRRLGYVRPMKKVKPGRVQAVVEIDGQQVSNGPLRQSKEAKVVLMVDPLEAKRLAAVEWKLLKEQEALQKQQRIEAINGGWAVLGLTVGIVFEGYTGKSILAQVAGYLDSLADFIARITPGS